MKKLPKKVFVAWQEEGTENEYLVVSTNVEMLVEQGEQKSIGIYELKETKTAVNKTEFKIPY